jgi:FixJ family two-component response regulator
LDRDVRIPIVVITACDDIMIAAKESLGATDFFLEPVAKGALVAAIRSTRRRS